MGGATFGEAEMVRMALPEYLDRQHPCVQDAGDERQDHAGSDPELAKSVADGFIATFGDTVARPDRAASSPATRVAHRG